MIPRIDLSPNFSISRVLTGLWQIADMEKGGNTLDIPRSAQAMVPYVNAGLTTFDMADHYGSAEEIAGYFHQEMDQENRSQLLTKWVPKPGKIQRDDVRTAIHRSLERMKTDSIDLLQYHAWQYCDPIWLDTLLWLQELKEEGLIKNIGLTNFDANHLLVAVTSGIEIVSNQISFSLIDTRAHDRMQKISADHKVKILAFGTLAGGFLTNKWISKKEPEKSELQTWSQMKYFRFIKEAGGWNVFQGLLSTLKNISSKHQSSIASIAAKYILDQSEVGGIIIGARLGQSDHIEETTGIFEIDLDDEDRNLIKEAQNNLKRIPGNCGDEYRKPPYLTASGDLSHHLEDLPKVFEPITNANERSMVLSGTIWEDIAGFSRAVRKGNKIYVSGTTATNGELIVGKGSAEAQTIFILDKIQGAIESLGGSLEDVVRTTIFVNDVDHWEAAARIHGEYFRDIQPANTLVEARLVGDGYLVEIELEAIVDND